MLSGYFKRTSGREMLLLVMTYITTFIATQTFPRTRSDAKPAEIHSYASTLDANISLNTMQFAATDWLLQGKERQPQTVMK